MPGLMLRAFSSKTPGRLEDGKPHAGAVTQMVTFALTVLSARSCLMGPVACQPKTPASPC